MAVQNHVLLIGIAILLTATLTEQHFIQFSYSGSTGPDKWGSLSPSYSACSTGKSQSPINIVSKDAVLSEDLKSVDRDYSTANGTLINAGVSVGLFYDHGVGVASIDDKKYNLKQMHWHSPAEHTLDGVRHPVELHLVHTSDDGGVAVVAILFKYGDSDPLVAQLMGELDEMAKQVCGGNGETHVPVANIDTKHLKRSTKKYFRYVGSLTVPPCSEHVTWTILGKVRDISKEQVQALKAPLDAGCKNNSRPVQPLNGRKVKLYHDVHGDDKSE